LERYLKLNSPLSINQIRNLIGQLLTAVSILHGHGIFHRDIKPQNILITQNGCLKLADFGLAREYNCFKLYTSVVITLWYRSPEILLQAPYCTSADIWSVGCILGEMGYQKPLFSGKTEIDQLKKIIQLLGLPDYWPKESKITRESFLKCQKSSLSLERLVHFEDACAFDLLESLLAFKKDERCSASKALEHNFFKKSDHTQCTIVYDLEEIKNEINEYNQTPILTRSPLESNNSDEVVRGKKDNQDSFEYDYQSSPDLDYLHRGNNGKENDCDSPIDVVGWFNTP